jgi:hypothetical protein
MTACEIFVSPDRRAGGIIDTAKDELLPFVFSDLNEATRFLEAAERCGLNLWPGMAKAELASFVRLWRDADKR